MWRAFSRQSLHTTTWQRAQKLTVEAEARGSWDPLPEEAQAAPITIAEATARLFPGKPDKESPLFISWRRTSRPPVVPFRKCCVTHVKLETEPMDITVHIPDDLAGPLNAAAGDLSRRALEGLALEEFKNSHITKAQLRRLLGFETRYELDGFLKAHGILMNVTVEDVRRDVQTLQRLGF